MYVRRVLASNNSNNPLVSPSLLLFSQHQVDAYHTVWVHRIAECQPTTTDKPPAHPLGHQEAFHLLLPRALLPLQVGVLGLNFPYKQGESKVQPGFTFMDISDRYVIARGAGGGLALWLRQDTV